MKLKIALNIHGGSIEEIQSACKLLMQTAISELVEEGADSQVYKHLMDCGPLILQGDHNGKHYNDLIRMAMTSQVDNEFTTIFRQCAETENNELYNDLADALDDLEIKDLKDLIGAVILAKSRVEKINNGEDVQ